MDRLWSNGIWTIIDLHQDVISPVVCGEGAPDWMIDFDSLGSKPLPQPLNKSAPAGSCAPTGLLKFIGWSELYLTDACGKVFQVYTNNIHKNIFFSWFCLYFVSLFFLVCCYVCDIIIAAHLYFVNLV